MYNAIIKKLSKTGIEAYTTVFSAGLYYDGEQHGKIYDCVRICIDKRDRIQAATIEKAVKNALVCYPDITFRRVYHPFYHVYTIASDADFMEAEQLDKTAKTWLDAFHMDIHIHPEHRENNAALAIEAANVALEEAC